MLRLAISKTFLGSHTWDVRGPYYDEVDACFRRCREDTIGW